MSSLQHRIFRKLLIDMSSEYADITHNDICWLNKGKVLEWVVLLKSEIITFLESSSNKKSSEFKDLLLDNNFMANVNFLCNIFTHLNNLNE